MSLFCCVFVLKCLGSFCLWFLCLRFNCQGFDVSEVWCVLGLMCLGYVCLGFDVSGVWRVCGCRWHRIIIFMTYHICQSHPSFIFKAFLSVSVILTCQLFPILLFFKSLGIIFALASIWSWKKDFYDQHYSSSFFSYQYFSLSLQDINLC